MIMFRMLRWVFLESKLQMFTQIRISMDTIIKVERKQTY